MELLAKLKGSVAIKISWPICLPSNCSLKNYPHGGGVRELIHLLLKGNYERSQESRVIYLLGTSTVGTSTVLVL